MLSGAGGFNTVGFNDAGGFNEHFFTILGIAEYQNNGINGNKGDSAGVFAMSVELYYIKLPSTTKNT